MKVVIDRKEYLRKWRNRSRRYLLLHGAKNRARKKNVPFSISLEDIPEIPEKCPILGIPLKHHEGLPGWHDDSPTLDRIFNDKGYVKDNLRIISSRANRLKADATLEELENLLIDARLHRY